jgi:hypothetical protein
MKTYFSLFLLAGMLLACNNETTEISDDTRDTAHIEEPPVSGKVLKDTDTFSVGNKHFTIQPLASSSFSKLTTPDYDSTEDSQIAKDPAHVKRSGDALYITLNNGQVTQLANNTRDDEANYATYFYAGYLPAIHHYLVFGSYYESSDYVLINADNGTITHVWGVPVISPDHKYLICPSVDLVAGFNNNGFQLYSYTDNKLVLEGDVVFDKWGPGQMKWLDNKTIEAEYVVLDDDMNEVPKPVKLLIN